MDLSAAEKKATATLKTSTSNNWLLRSGILLMVASAGFLLWSFYPVLYQEIKYQLSAKNNDLEVATKEELAALPDTPQARKNILEPVDENFGIVIPKIEGNAKVIPGVDPNNPAAYQRVLTQGVAASIGSAVPGEEGNIFIFAHSGIDFFEAQRYNAVFYLLDKLAKGDDIYLFYQGQKLTYKVIESKIVDASEVQYLKGTPGKKTVTLMTCWPAGTTLKRLIVIGEQA